MTCFGLGHLKKFRARGENTKTQFLGARGTFGETIRPSQKFLPEIAQLFYVLFWPAGPPGAGNREILGLYRLFWPRTLTYLRDSPGEKQKKHNFPVLGALSGGKTLSDKKNPQVTKKISTVKKIVNRKKCIYFSTDENVSQPTKKF